MDAAKDSTAFQVDDERVRAATGRRREEWFDVLDAAGAAEMAHADIARLLTGEHGVEGWWAQTVTVDYELARGLRARHQKRDGFAISKSKTLPVPTDAAYRAWADDSLRAQWLGTALEVSSVQEQRTVRGRWDGGPDRIAVYLTAKGAQKTQVNVQHERLSDAEAAEREKQRWAERLTALAQWLEDPR